MDDISESLCAYCVFHFSSLREKNKNKSSYINEKRYHI